MIGDAGFAALVSMRKGAPALGLTIDGSDHHRLIKAFRHLEWRL
jgi:hypothetical protein